MWFSWYGFNAGGELLSFDTDMIGDEGPRIPSSYPLEDNFT